MHLMWEEEIQLAGVATPRVWTSRSSGTWTAPMCLSRGGAEREPAFAAVDGALVRLCASQRGPSAQRSRTVDFGDAVALARFQTRAREAALHWTPGEEDRAPNAVSRSH